MSLGDADIADFFEKNLESLKESFVFVFSDHGHRFDPIRQSVIGRIEERMPFFSLHVPDSLFKEDPLLREVLASNSQVEEKRGRRIKLQRLTSFWDLYATLREILHQGDRWRDLGGEQPLKRLRTYSKRGLSLLHRLPEKRTCDEAGIPEDFCVCQRENLLNTSDPKVCRFYCEVSASRNAPASNATHLKLKSKKVFRWPAQPVNWSPTSTTCSHRCLQDVPVSR